MVKSKMLKLRSSTNISGYLYLAPALIILFFIFIVPLTSSLYLSFTKWISIGPGTGPQFVGLQNYIKILSNPEELNSFKVTFIFVLCSVIFEMVIGIGLALLLNRQFKGLNVFRTLIILPMMISEIVAALSWRYMLQTDFGIVNHFLKILGFEARVWTDEKHALLSIILIEVWQHIPFVVLIILAALQSLSSDVLEASVVDGASYRQRLFQVILPMITPQIFVALVFRTMFTLRTFTQPWVLTGGGPADGTLVLGINIYRKAFRYHDMGAANALSWVMIVVSFCIVLVYISLLDKGDKLAHK